MKTHGCTWNVPLIVMMLGTTMVLFITLPISPTVDSTLGESIFGLIENLREKNEE
jgi:hypothetical protein